jgi:hypothetical protein
MAAFMTLFYTYTKKQQMGCVRNSNPFVDPDWQDARQGLNYAF